MENWITSNRTSVELKLGWVPAAWSQSVTSNRTSVELKLIKDNEEALLFNRTSNRTSVELKLGFASSNDIGKSNF